MTVKIEELKTINKARESRLVEVWESAVRATHNFLAESDMQFIKKQVTEALTQGEAPICAFDQRKEIQAFLMIEKRKIEMLFVHPDVRGTGIGRKLTNYALNNYNVKYVDVNEQNIKGILSPGVL